MRLTRRGRLTITITAVTIVLLVVAYALTQTPAGTVLGVRTKPSCTITVDGETRNWSWEKAMTATTVAGVGESVGAGLNGIAAALNLTIESDVAITPAAARGTYRTLPQSPPPTPASASLARAVLGYAGAALSCAVPTIDLGKRTGDALPREEPGPLGLTPRADRVRTAMREVFDKQTLGGFAPEGVQEGHIDGSAHYEGRAVDVFFRPISVDNRRRGWVLAHWLAANAERLQIATIIFDGRIWTARQSVRGWREYQHPDGPTTNPILLHQDHVHVDVREGG